MRWEWNKVEKSRAKALVFYFAKDTKKRAN